MIDVDTEQTYGALQACHAEMDEVAAWPDGALFGALPAVSGWPPAAHLYHLTQVNALVFKSIRVIAAGRAPMPDEGPNRYGILCLTQGRLPRGRGVAPERTHPPANLDRPALADALHRNAAALAGLQTHLPALSSYPGRLPHPILGNFDAAQWLLFAKIHTTHHLEIVRDIQRARPPSTT